MKPNETHTARIPDTRITCPVCGTTDYYVRADKTKACTQCGQPLDDIPEAPLKYVDKTGTRSKRTFPEPPVIRRPDPAPAISREDVPRESMQRPPRQDAPGSLLQRMLTGAKRTGITMRVITINGYNIMGTIADFDGSTVLVEGKDEERLVNIHAISTIVPGTRLLTRTQEAKA